MRYRANAFSPLSLSLLSLIFNKMSFMLNCFSLETLDLLIQSIREKRDQRKAYTADACLLTNQIVLPRKVHSASSYSSQTCALISSFSLPLHGRGSLVKLLILFLPFQPSPLQRLSIMWTRVIIFIAHHNPLLRRSVVGAFFFLLYSYVLIQIA